LHSKRAKLHCSQSSCVLLSALSLDPDVTMHTFLLQTGILSSIEEMLARSRRGGSSLQLSAIGGFQEQLDGAAASGEEQACAALKVTATDLRKALLAHSGEPDVAKLQAEVAAMNVCVEIPLKQFTPVFVRVLSAQADAVNDLSQTCTSAKDIEKLQSVHEEQAMVQALGGEAPLCVFTLNCAIHCQQSSQFKAQLQRILAARAEQFKQWGCFEAAAKERAYMQMMGIRQSPQGAQRGMVPGRF